MRIRPVLSVLLTLAALPVGACEFRGNLARNCGFDQDLTAWTVLSGSCAVDAQVGASRPGSAVCASATQDGVNVVALQQCAPAGAGDYIFAANTQRLSGADIDCRLVAASHRTADCSALTDRAIATLTSDGARFTRSAAQGLYLDATTRALSLDIACVAAMPFVVSIDDVTGMPDTIFKNGFEFVSPVLTAGATLSYTENQAASVIDAALTVSDVDSTTLAGATVQISANYQNGADSLAFTPLGAISGSFAAVTGTLTLSGTDTLANYQTALRSVTFVNNSDTPNTPARTITWIANDGTAPSSSPVTSTVTLAAVNDAPVLAGTANLNYTENAAATVLSSALTITDVDSTTLTGATVRISSNFDTGKDVLAFTAVGGITGSFVSDTLTLSGTTSLANYQTALRSVTYRNTSDNPSALTRNVTWQVNDGGASNNLSNALISTIAVTTVNDAPTVNAPSFAVTSNIAISQPDDAVNDLLGNARMIADADFAGPFTIAAASLGPRATAQGGTINIAASGSFNYNPPLNFAGPTDTVGYQVCDAGTPLPAVCTAVTITFNLSGLAIVFVDDSAAPGGNGTLQAPLQTIAAGIAALGSGAGSSNLFVFSGNYPQTVTQVLPNNARLFGQGSLAANFDALYAITPAALSIARPALSQTRPIISSGTVACLTLGQGNTLRGFEIGACITDALAGTNFGTLTVPSDNMVLNNTTGRALNLSTGTGAATFASIASTGSATQGINLSAVGGSLAVSGATSITNPTGTGINIVSSGGAITFAATTVSKTSAGTGVNLGGAGTGNSGAVTFDSLGITTSAGAALIGTDNTGTVTVTNNTANISATGGPAINITKTATPLSPIALNLGTVSSSTSATQAVNLVFTSGTLTTTGGTLQTAAGTTFAIGTATASSGGTAAVTYPGTITQATSAQAPIVIQNSTAGTKAFSGQITATAAGVRGISLLTNTGATIDFTGGINLSTAANPAFTATGGGTVSATQNNTSIVNTLTSTTGTALTVANTTIGASGLTFRSIHSGAGASLGINLVSTGAGGLTVTGTDGADAGTDPDVGSGGTITGKTGTDGSATSGTGVLLSSANNVSLNGMIISNHQNYGIRGNEVDGFRLTFSQVAGVNGTNVATPFNEGSISFVGTPTTGYGLRGAVAFLDNEITGGRQRNVSIDNATGTMNLNFLRNNVHDTQPSPNGDDGFAIEVDTSAVMFANVSSNVFTAHGGDHFNLSLVNSANAHLTFKNNDMQGGFAGALGQGVFILGASYNGTFRYDISNNGTVADPFVGNVQGGAIFVNKGSGTGIFSGQITNNVIGNPAVTGSGTAQAVGIHASARGAGGSHTTLINNNMVRQYFDRGITLEAGEGAPTFVATVTNNTVSNFADAINSLHGIHFDFGILTPDNAQITIDVRANSIATAGNEPQGGADFRMRTAGSNDVFIGGYSGGNSSANTQTFIAGQNPAATTTSVTQAASGTYNNGPAVPFALPTLPTLPPAP